MTFLAAAEVLIQLHEALPSEPNDEGRRVLREVSDLLHTALVWHWFLIGNFGTAVPEIGSSVHRLLFLDMSGTSTSGYTNKENRVRRILAVINGTILGQAQPAADAAEAASFCSDVGAYLTWRSRCGW